MRNKGVSLIESLISLTLFFLVLLAVFEVFGLVRKYFLQIKKAQEESMAALACLDKMRVDFIHAGLGLSPAIRHGAVPGAIKENDAIAIFSLEATYHLAADLTAGAALIPLTSEAKISSGREICLVDEAKAERKVVSSRLGNQVLHLMSPLDYAYDRDAARVLLLERVALYLDEENGIIRRKVNTSSPQPLLEDVAIFDASIDEENNLIKACLALKSAQEKIYELFVFPKNTALPSVRH